MDAKPKIEKKFFLIVIDTGEEIEMGEDDYKALYQCFNDGTVKSQFPFRDKTGQKYIEQRHNVRMRETSEVIY